MGLLHNGGRPIEILLVEDEAEAAETTMEALRDGRVRNRVHWVQDGRVRNRVHWVQDGEEAIAFLRRQGQHGAAPRPELILLDLNMPRMNGHEVLAIIKQHQDWKRIPVVIMTSSENEKDVSLAYDLHANCYVTKPLDFDKFMGAVRSIEDFWMSIVRLPAA